MTACAALVWWAAACLACVGLAALAVASLGRRVSDWVWLLEDDPNDD
jgi:hypothetical protein